MRASVPLRERARFASDGSIVLVRALEPRDRRALLALFSHLSDESRYSRFLTQVPRLDGSTLRWLLDTDEHDHVAVVAARPGQGRLGDPLLGVARFVRPRDDATRAEVAVAVRDDHQRRGIGTLLVRELADRARADGIRTLHGTMLSSNDAVPALMRAAGLTLLEVRRQGPVTDAEWSVGRTAV